MRDRIEIGVYVLMLIVLFVNLTSVPDEIKQLRLDSRRTVHGKLIKLGVEE